MNALTKAELAQQALFLSSLATKAKERLDAVRSELETIARDELQRDGAAPTWRIPGVGTVPLSLTADTVDVVDQQAYIEWVHASNPGEVETIVTVQVRPAYDKMLREQAAKRGPARDAEGEVIPGAARDGLGDVIPGLVFKAGGQAKGISIRPAAAAKEASLQLAEVFVDSLLQSALEVSQ